MTIELDPVSFWSHFNLGNGFYESERWEAAASAFQTAIELDSGISWAHNNLGNALTKLERWEEAAAAYQRAIDLKPDLASAYENLGNALARLRRWEVAIAAYKSAIELQPDSFSLHYGAGDVSMEMERWEAAVFAYQRATELNPKAFWAHNNLGDALLKLERWNEAADAYARAVALNPYLSQFQQNLVNALWRSDRCEEAVSAYECAIEASPELFLPHHDFGDVLMKLGRCEEAAAAYRRADELNAAWSKYSPTESLAQVEHWIEQKSTQPHGESGDATGESTARTERLMFILDTDYGELTTVMYLLLGQQLLGRTTLLLPPRLYINNNDSLPGRTFLYSSFEDIVKMVDVEKPDIVFLCSAYLFSIHGILPIEGLEKLVRFLSDRGCRVVTSDPFLYTLANASLSTISIDIPENSPPQLQRMKYEQDQRLVENLTGSFQILKNVPHLYPAYPRPREQGTADEGFRSVSFFNFELIPAVKLNEETPLWFFILASRDYELHIIFHGRAWVIEGLVHKFEETLRAGRRAVFIGPYDCVQALLQRMPATEGVSLLTYCSFKRFASLLLSAEYAFYWNVVSHTMLLRLFNEQPVFMFDRGHLVRSVKPLYERVVDWYYQGYEPMYLDQARGLDPDVLAGMVRDYRETAHQISKGMRRAPSPEEMIHWLMGVS